MDIVRRFGLTICAAILIALSVGFIAHIWTADGGDGTRSLLGMDFAFAADGSDGANLLWTAIAAAVGAFALLSLLAAFVPARGDRREVATESHPVAAEEHDERAIDTVGVQRRMKEVAETVDGVQRADTYADADGMSLQRSRIDLYLDEGRDIGRISDEVAERVRNTIRDEYETEPSEGLEIDVHQPRRFFGTQQPA
ncbi:MAG: hypothetical protein GEU28_11790 [Dehalococcoidia bacterium]|nr:hypothetical protein [Dehalococcoidia bacterium]